MNAAQAKKLRRAGWALLLGAALPLGAWLALAPLSMAVVAPGAVRVDLNRRPVQHLEGGIVREVLVRDGQRVATGDPVLVLGDVRVDVERNRLEYRLALEQAAIARHEAERAYKSAVVFPEELHSLAIRDARVAGAMAKEKSVFAARREALLSEIALIERQRGHVEQEIAALAAQIAKAEEALALQKNDLKANRNLAKDGFISQTRLSQIEANVTDYAAKLEERRSELARASQRKVDAELRIKSLRNEYAQAASGELKVAAARAAEIEQELRKSQDAAARQVVVAPAAGEIIDLRINSAGAVVRPGDTIAEIVPSDARLLVEARIRPEDIGAVRVGQRARVRLTAFKYRNDATAEGSVTYVSGDRLVDRATGVPYYTATIAATGNVEMQAGMSAEVYIEGTRQTPLEYLAEPVMSTLRRSARQM